MNGDKDAGADKICQRHHRMESGRLQQHSFHNSRQIHNAGNTYVSRFWETFFYPQPRLSRGIG